MSQQALVSFYTESEQEEKEELSRVIRDSFHPHHKDRSQPGSFAMTTSVSTVPSVCPVADGSYFPQCNM